MSSSSSANDAVLSLPEREIANKVFGIPLIVRRICFFSVVESRKDLLRLRLLNRVFQEEATRELRGRPTKHSIRLWQESQMKEFVELMKRRQEVLGLRPPFPFSSFTLHQDWDTNFYLNSNWDSGLIQNFSKMTGGQIRRLDFLANTQTIEHVMTILSHSPHLVQMTCNYEWMSWSHLTPEQLPRLPTTFHQLRDLSLEYEDLREEDGDELCPLFELLIRRSPGLERVRVPLLDIVQDPDMRILRFLTETQSRNLPLISFHDSIIVRPNRPVTTEWMELNCHFRKIEIRMFSSREATDLEVGNMKRRVETWIELQSATLTTLGLEFDQTLPPLILPPLPSLQSLAITYHLNPGEELHCPIEPLDPSRYPSLHKLCIYSTEDDAGRLSTGPMGSIQVLEMHSVLRFTNPSWKQTFPNLTSLNFHFDHSSFRLISRSDENDESSIAFILTHFPALVHLDIHHWTRNLCLWNVLTAAAPTLPPNSLHVNTNSVPTFPPEPLTGIYEIPSLGNMRALRTLEMGPIYNQGTLDAILHMTCAGLLGPLQTLSLEIDKQLLPVEGEREDYRRGFARVHREVTLHFN